MRTLVSLTETFGFFVDLFQTVFMEDSENVGKGEMLELNRTVVHLPCEIRRVEYLAHQSRVERSPKGRIDSLLMQRAISCGISSEILRAISCGLSPAPPA